MPYDIIIGRSESDKKRLGKDGLTYIGKGYVTMGQYTSLSNPIFMDVARSHVILIAGKRGSGKSYTLGVLTEELANLPKEVSQNIASLIFDTMGIYWTMKYKNEKDKELLEEWNLKPKNLPVKVFVPRGHFQSYMDKGIPVDERFALDISEMNSEDWIITFGLDIISPVSVLIQRTINRLKQKGEFVISDVINEIDEDKRTTPDTKNAAIGLFEAAETWGVFATKDEKPTKVSDLINAGSTTVLDLSVYNSVGAFNVRALTISLISRKIFNERMEARKKEEIKSVTRGLDLTTTSEKKEVPLIWMFIDEAHEFLPLGEKTIATDALVQLLREGRQPGISLVLATQQPGQIHRDVMTQSDIVIAHRVTAKPDVDALNFMMQSYLLESVKRYMDELPSLKGSAIILDDNSERIYPMRMRPRFTWHGGEAPTAVKIEKRL
jgi:DNA helicase HerA-like ATPase